MNVATLKAFALAIAGSAVLVGLGFDGALEGAGPYKALPGLSSWLAVGLGLSNLLVLLLVGLAASRVCRLSNAVLRRSTLFALMALAGLACLAAPLLPSFALAGVCVRQSLCPDIANPLLWAYLRGFTDLPGAPLVVAPLVAMAMHLLAKRGSITDGA